MLATSIKNEERHYPRQDSLQEEIRNAIEGDLYASNIPISIAADK